jgi:carbon-monoxide dehydrogenase large subunit
VTRPNAYIGSPIERIEDQRLLSGSATFVGDLNPAGLYHAVILRSTVAHGVIRSVDASAARSHPGIVAVITAADVGEVPIIPFRQHAIPQAEPYLQPVIARDKVRYVGEPIAVIIAIEQAIAEDALAFIRVEIDELTPVADHIVSARGETLLFEQTGTTTRPSSPRAWGMQIRRSSKPTIRVANASACNATPPCQWNRAAS